DCRSRRLRGLCRGKPKGDDNCDAAFDQIGRHPRKPVVSAVCKALLKDHITAFDVTRFGESLAELRCRSFGRTGEGAEKADHRHRLLLRMASERPEDGRAAEQTE